jgi:hypothetical protein
MIVASAGKLWNAGIMMPDMAKAPPRKRQPADIELHPDAWDRFTEFVKRITKAGPQHRTAKGRVPSPIPRGKRGGSKEHQ